MYRQTNMLQLPLLGVFTTQQLKDSLSKTIIDEATTVEFYRRLRIEAPNQLHHRLINQICEDELAHLNRFEKLYYYYFGSTPKYEVVQTPYPTYQERILASMEGELTAVKFYRDVQLSTNDQLARDTYYHAMVDELQHATIFSTLLNDALTNSDSQKSPV